MKILFIFTGGTIGSTLNGDYITTEQSKAYSIISAYQKKHGINFDYDVAEPYTELSENNTGLNIKNLAKCVKENVVKDYDGIIVTHGTDTLQFTSSAIGYTTGNNTIPVCFVSSNYPIENPLSNGLDNLHGAINFINAKLGKGTFVIYRNGNSLETIVHRATRLISGKAFSDEVDSVFDLNYGKFDKDFNYIKNESYSEKQDEIAPLNADLLTEKCGEVAWISPYPGMVYPELNKGVKYTLLNTYHSGTINTKSQEAKRFFDKVKLSGIKVYITGVTDGPSYDSAKAFDEFGIIPIKNISPVSAFVKLWILTDEGLTPDEILQKSLGGDIAIK
jgi:L-asparaginase